MNKEPSLGRQGITFTSTRSSTDNNRVYGGLIRYNSVISPSGKIVSLCKNEENKNVIGNDYNDSERDIIDGVDGGDRPRWHSGERVGLPTDRACVRVDLVLLYLKLTTLTFHQPFPTGIIKGLGMSSRVCTSSSSWSPPRYDLRYF